MKCNEWDTSCRQTSPREPSFGERRQMFLPDITHELHAEHVQNDNSKRRRPLHVTGAAVYRQHRVAVHENVSNTEWYHGTFRLCYPKG